MTLQDFKDQVAMTKRIKILLGIVTALVIPMVINMVFQPDHIYWVSLPGLWISFLVIGLAIGWICLVGPFIILGLMITVWDWLNSK